MSLYVWFDMNQHTYCIITEQYHVMGMFSFCILIAKQVHKEQYYVFTVYISM